MNRTGNNQDISAEAVPPEASRDLVQRAFDLEAARRFIIAERVMAGADTPLGHRCSNMVELIENYRAAGSAFQVSHIKAALVRTVAEIAEIKGRRALPAPAKMLSANQ